ncbi:MAG: FAD-dependent oxidoreductase [Planctomycetota bacterium]|nr:FAD-dependent oxidoreductase [Planctomycetota bacterium]MDI6787909.1 FAD-dependent oxidoreductase [Planctomycetota bacterium]
MITIEINSQSISAEEGQSVLNAALSAGGGLLACPFAQRTCTTARDGRASQPGSASGGQSGIYIPHLCSHPDLDNYSSFCSPQKGGADSGDITPSTSIYQGTNRFEHQALPGRTDELGCKLCLVEIEGKTELQRACATLVTEGMKVVTESERVKQARQENLARILSQHPHSCLTCAQQEGCSLTQCSSNVPVPERCCPKFGRCEIQKVSSYIGIPLGTPRYIPSGDERIIEADPLVKRNYDLCIGCLRCVRICRNLRGVDALGFVLHNGKVVVGSREPSLRDSSCKFCGACVEVCPSGAMMDKISCSDADTGSLSLPVLTGSRRDKGSLQGRKSLVPCQGNCPAGMDVPSYIRLIKEGNIEKAKEVISHKVPFPSVLGYVCFHPCETECRRKEINDPIDICALKRYAMENSKSEIRPVRAKSVYPVGKIKYPQSAIAIIGAGPAGLAAAFYLSRKGYPVTLFEANNQLGGMMRYAVPEYRLPLKALQDDLVNLLNENITLKTSQKLGRDFTLQSLQEQGFKAILLAIGAQKPKKLPLTADVGGEKHPLIRPDGRAYVRFGIEFLKDIKAGKVKTDELRGMKVMVIGGGNVAIDVCLSARRLGASEVNLVCLESRETMPAHEWEITQSLEEGIILNCGWGPKTIREDTCPEGEVRRKGDTFSLEFMECTRVFDDAGKFNPSFNKDHRMTIHSNLIIITIGQVPETDNLPLERNPDGTLKTDENFRTSMGNVFACGEVKDNPSSVIQCISEGRKAAENIDKYLGGDGIIDREIEIPLAKDYLGKDEKFCEYQRVAMPSTNLSQRANNFNLIELGYTKEQALYEVSRCLQCDLRLKISPVIFPPEIKEMDFLFTEEYIQKVPSKEGVYLLLNENKDVILIKGTINLQNALLEQINNTKGGGKAKYFRYELDPFYTKKESELLQQYLQKHGKLPSGGDELDELY